LGHWNFEINIGFEFRASYFGFLIMPQSPLGSTVPLVPPLYQSSVYTIADLDALERLYNAEETGFIYARDGHPNAKLLADRISALEHANWSLICGSGMAALSAAILPLVRQGDRIVASNRLYGRTNQLLKQELSRFGVQTTIIDCSDLAQVATALKTPARVLLVETMSNPLCRLVDIEALARLAHQHECRLLVDNTFATPELVKPLDLGADMVMESLTKMMGGHGDITLGVLCGKEADMLAPAQATVSIWGLAANPFDCWLAERGLCTLGIRMKAASANAAALADWLAGQSSVSRVVYPGRPDHPEHELAARLLHGNFGNMLCFELAGGRDAVNRFMRLATRIAFSPSLGSTQTTISHPWTTSHRYESPAEKKRQGIGEGLIRFSVGIEELSAIQLEMTKGLG
jgi:cystathionine beta-lyase/cystathionine gamma-synthase